MDTSEALRGARRRAGLSQRELHRITGVAQPTIARIESGVTMPRVDTFSRLLEACGATLITAPAAAAAASNDREVIRQLLRGLTPAQRRDMFLEETHGSPPESTPRAKTGRDGATRGRHQSGQREGRSRTR